MSAGPDRPEHMEQETRLRALHELEQAELRVVRSIELSAQLVDELSSIQPRSMGRVQSLVAEFMACLDESDELVRKNMALFDVYRPMQRGGYGEEKDAELRELEMRLAEGMHASSPPDADAAR